MVAKKTFVNKEGLDINEKKFPGAGGVGWLNLSLKKSSIKTSNTRFMKSLEENQLFGNREIDRKLNKMNGFMYKTY